MAGFTLVHGSTQNASAFTAVAEELRALGHSVSVPDLPKNQPSWNLAHYARFIADAIPPPRPRIVVAHSFSGVFLPLVAASADLLVFEAAVVPEPSRSVYEQFLADRSMFSPEWIAAGARWFDPAEQQNLAREFLFHDCPERALAAALATVELVDTRHLTTERCPLAEWPQTSGASIVCDGDRTLSPEWSRAAAVNRLGAAPVELSAGHCPHTSRPKELVEILEHLARIQ
jgi:pimeloyl-ACP methyl ester carboxylesterase